MTDELLNRVRELRGGSGVFAVRSYLEALYEETKEKWVASSGDQDAALKAEANLLKRLFEEFGKEPTETKQQPDGAYN